MHARSSKYSAAWSVVLCLMNLNLNLKLKFSDEDEDEYYLALHFAKSSKYSCAHTMTDSGAPRLRSARARVGVCAPI